MLGGLTRVGHLGPLRWEGAPGQVSLREVDMMGLGSRGHLLVQARGHGLAGGGQVSLGNWGHQLAVSGHLLMRARVHLWMRVHLLGVGMHLLLLGR